MTEPPVADEPPKDQATATDAEAPKPRRQRWVTIAAIGGAVVVGALLFSAGGGGSSAPTAPSSTASAPATAVTTGPPGPTAPTVSVVESTAVGPDALAIGSSGTFSTEEASGVVTVTNAEWRETADSASGVLPVIEVKIQVTAGQWVADPFNFGLQDAKGEVYPVLAGAVEDQLAAGDIRMQAGQRRDSSRLTHPGSRSRWCSPAPTERRC